MKIRTRLILPLVVLLVFSLSAGCTAEPVETTLPTQITTDPPTVPPTDPPTEAPTEEPTVIVDADRLAAYQDLFRWEGSIIHARAAGHSYTSPAEADLYYIFYNGVGYPGSWADISQSEADFLLEEGFWREGDIQIMPAGLLEAELQQYFGVGLADVRIPEKWAYSPDTDTYYSNHNDAYVPLVTVTGFTELDEETVVLHLIVDMFHDHDFMEVIDNAPVDMTIRPNEGGGRILSNVLAG